MDPIGSNDHIPRPLTTIGAVNDCRRRCMFHPHGFRVEEHLGLILGKMVIENCQNLLSVKERDWVAMSSFD
jgi:hypothetical protein